MTLNQQTFVSEFQALARRVVETQTFYHLQCKSGYDGAADILNGPIDDVLYELWGLGKILITTGEAPPPGSVENTCINLASYAVDCLCKCRAGLQKSEAVDTMVGLVIAKNHDYAGEKDPLLNLRMCEQAGIPAWVGISSVRIADKFSRIRNFFDTNTVKVKTESVEDTLVDLANYAILCAIAYKDSQGSFGP